MSVYQKIISSTAFQAESSWIRIRTIDMHTAGEPLRVIVAGFPEAEGETILQRRRFVKENYDHLRTALMFEPRGHADMYGCVLTPPEREDSDLGIIFMHNEGYSTMCGHATIAIAKLAVEMGWVEKNYPTTELKIDAPCGQLHAFVDIESDVANCRFRGVPSFIVALDQKIRISEYGSIKYDIAYGGAFYAYVDASQLNIDLTPENYSLLIQLGMKIKDAVAQKDDAIMQHPVEQDLSFLYGTIFIQHTNTPGIHSRNVCIFADGEVDRSPTGSGVSGRLAIHHERKEVEVGEVIKIESILGTVFSGKVHEQLKYGPLDAVIPEVGGTAYITGQHEFLIDPMDPLKEGFILR